MRRAESNGELYHKPLPKKVVTNCMGNGIDVVMMKLAYTNQQKTGTIKYIMQLEGSEKLASDKMGLITMNKDTQRDLLNLRFRINIIWGRSILTISAGRIIDASISRIKDQWCIDYLPPRINDA